MHGAIPPCRARGVHAPPGRLHCRADHTGTSFFAKVWRSSSIATSERRQYDLRRPGITTLGTCRMIASAAARVTPSSPDAYVLSRLGRETLEHGVARLAAAERLGMDLHPRIAQRVQQQFLLGEFELAVFASMKEVEVRVRQLAGESTSLLGTRLMQRAFSSDNGVLTDPDADPGEQVAMMEFFKGAIGLFKNPTSHRPVNSTTRPSRPKSY